uniref:Hemolymph juvenile hormone binding protein n=3 Tax=Dendroctonus ponderosae TaxID=77166 RepID=J3JUV2_DENPD|nr:unknown [Dendroctonus ponderosae]
MKTFTVLLVCFFAGKSHGKIPEYLQEYICKASDPKYEKCVLTSFEKTKPYLMKGIPELSLPPFDPFELPIMTVNRTLNDAVSINAIIRNIKVEGGRNTVIQGLRADPKKHVGEIRLSLPWTTIEMEYDVQGHLLTIPLQSRGFFFGNFTNTQFSIKGGLQTYEKDGNEYFRVKRINSKIVVGDGFIRLTSKNPDMQFGADLIANFFNEDPRRVLDTVNPIFIETSNQLFTVVADQILANLKASEWLPA